MEVKWPPGVHLQVELLADVDAVSIRCAIPTKDRDTGMSTVFFTVRTVSLAQPYDERYAKHLIHELLTSHVTHELDENILVDGVREWDPHPDLNDPHPTEPGKYVTSIDRGPPLVVKYGP